MKFNVSALAMTAAFIWGGAMLIVATANLIWPDYGNAFLQLIASIYPGYQPGGGVGSVILGTLYALADGAIGGALFGWLYNALAGKA